FLDKTKNDWSTRAFFEKVAGKYDMLSRDYSGDASADKVSGCGVRLSARSVDTFVQSPLRFPTH
ncbi:hypothetical protein scyTo_0027634, partial [Scyliorhinus torazame]|nr:hypothetical protein [Scyliorhinus torazame]